MKLPTWQTTYRFFYRLSEHISFGVIAQKCGVEVQTANAWARATESLENPNGSGKKNPFDCVLRLLALAHSVSAGLAREIAQMFIEYVNFLDKQSGATFVKRGGTLHEILGESAKEHTDILIEILKSPTPDYDQVSIEYHQAQAKFNELGAAIEELRKAEIKSDLRLS